jgi:hypothetical protein
MGYTNAVISTILAKGSGGTQPAYREHPRLPVALELSCFKNVSSSGNPGLGKKIKCFSETRQSRTPLSL